MSLKVTPSNEQLEIINALGSNNVVVNSVAGSGKTTTSLLIAQRYESLNILLLTYNAKLKIDTREKCKLYNINNLEPHSYHAFCVKYYNSKAYVDDGINKVIENSMSPKKKFKYDIVIIDECQDLTYLYYKFICKIFEDMENEPKIAILGDKYQNIFGFKGADERYIVYADQLFNFNEYKWVKLNLSTSYRITNQMSEFVNTCMLGTNRIKANKDNVKVKYMITYPYGNHLYTIVTNLLRNGYKPDDIFLLAPTIKSLRCPIRVLSNKLSDNNNIPIYAPVSDDEKIDNDVMKGKLVVSTFHQVKGLERKIVIVFNFDNSYFRYNATDADPNVCSNALYVAVTRATEKLILIHDKGQDYLPFIDKDRISTICDFTYTPVKAKGTSIRPFYTSVTKLVKFLPNELSKICMDLLQVEKIQEKDSYIDIPMKVEQGDLTESVSEITGTAVHLYYEGKMKGYVKITDSVYHNDPLRYNDIYNLIENVDNSTILKFANYVCAYQSGYIHKINQITDYDWLSKDNLDKAMKRLEVHLTKNSVHEVDIKHEGSPELLNRKLNGFIDCVDKDVWEFKCVRQLEDDHFIQLAVYMYLYKIKYPNSNKKFKLFNILTNEIYTVDASDDNLREIVRLLMVNKFINKPKISDEEFLSENGV